MSSISRRELFQLGSAIAAEAMLVGCRKTTPPETKSQNELNKLTPTIPAKPAPKTAPATTSPVPILQPFSEASIHPELRRLGQEIKDWTLVNGIKVVDISDDAKTAASLLAGEIDPRTYIPKLVLPIGFGTDTEIGELIYHSTRERVPTKTVNVTQPNGKFERYSWITMVDRLQFKLAPNVLSNSLRLPIIIKEAMSFVDQGEYEDFYLSFLRARRSIGITNPQNEPISDREKIFNEASAIRDIEWDNFNYSTLQDFCDTGPALRSGTIVYAIWAADQQKQGFTIPEAKWSKVGKQNIGHLEENGLIEEKDGIFNWKDGNKPLIKSLEFYRLFQSYMAKYIPERKVILNP